MTSLKKLNPFWQLLSSRTGTWSEAIFPFFESGGFTTIYQFLKEESESGKKIAPLSSDTFKCFLKTPIDSVRVVILALCPYHTEGVADGLALSCGKTNRLQPSLEKLWEAWETEFNNGLCLQCTKGCDLSYLAEQGVLLLNAALTVEIGKPKSHNKIWKPFTSYIMGVIGKMDVPVIFLGNDASEFGWCIPKEENKIFISHPASASYRKTKWDSEGAFTACNKILENKGIEPIKWLEEAPF